MSYLFIDSTYDLTIGVLDDGLSWLSLETLTGQKVSTVIQKCAYEMLHKNQINPASLAGIITINGPGFYTGLRLSEGFADVLRFFGVPNYSFYSYEIPYWCGNNTGAWFTKAYRGEYFIHRWNQSVGENELLDTKSLATVLSRFEHIYIHSYSALDKTSQGLIKSSVSTLELLKTYPQQIFSKVLEQKLNREAFYFRAPEDEFKVNP